MSCFEAVQEYWGDAGLVEAVSLQEWKEVVDNTRLEDEGMGRKGRKRRTKN